LDHLEPQAAKGEGEKKWLLRALSRADTLSGLTNFLPAGSKGNPAEDAYIYFYASLRSVMFHAKRSRGTPLPHDPMPRQAIIDAHPRLASLYLALLEKVQGFRRPAGAVMLGGFERMTSSLDKNVVIHATDDEAAFDTSQTLIN